MKLSFLPTFLAPFLKKCYFLALILKNLPSAEAIFQIYTAFGGGDALSDRNLSTNRDLEPSFYQEKEAKEPPSAAGIAFGNDNRDTHFRVYSPSARRDLSCTFNLLIFQLYPPSAGGKSSNFTCLRQASLIGVAQLCRK